MASVDDRSPQHSMMTEHSQSRKRKRTEENGQQSYVSPAPFAVPFEDDDDYDLNKPLLVEDIRAGKVKRPIRIYMDGICDLFHSGHSKAFLQAKNMFYNVHLIVGLCSDKLTHKYKGFTVLSDEERYDAVSHCRYVDEIVRDAPWVVTPEYLKRYKIDFVAHDDVPYKSADHDDVYKEIKEMGRFLATERTEGISTSDLIARVIRDYDNYVRRNLKRGYTREEMNVSLIKEKELKAKAKLGEIKDNIIQKWEEKSREIIGGFLDMFGRDGRLKTWLEDKSVDMQTVISRALSPSPTHSGSIDEFSYDPEISGDDSDTEATTSKSQDVQIDDDDSDDSPTTKISRN